MTIADTARRIWSEWCAWLAKRRAARIERRRLAAIARREVEIAELRAAFNRARKNKRPSRRLEHELRRVTTQRLRMELGR